MRPYYEHGGVTLYCGDSREIVPDVGPVDLVLTDPPYPGYDKGWGVPDVGAVLAAATARTLLVFWPPLLAPPLPQPVAEHIWHKPNGNSAHHYERILVYGQAPRRCKVFRVAAILPNYVQYAREAVAHPTQKPVQLIRRLLAEHPGSTVLDPFAGSGTTLRAAKDLGRRAIGVEVNPDYCAMAAQRFAQQALPLEAP